MTLDPHVTSGSSIASSVAFLWYLEVAALMSTKIKIGELAKQTGISIRTLHYYDEIGLLSPSHRTESGHRLYVEQDIIRLQQVMSLRQLGFSLEEIRECLENANSASYPARPDRPCTCRTVPHSLPRETLMGLA